MVLFILLSPLKFSPVIGWMYTYSTVVTKIKYVNVSLECILKSLFDTITCASLLSNMIIVRLRSANLPRAIHVVCLLYLRLPGLRVDSVTSQSFYLHSMFARPTTCRAAMSTATGCDAHSQCIGHGRPLLTWSRRQWFNCEARLQQTPYPFHIQLIWRYMGIK